MKSSIVTVRGTLMGLGMAGMMSFLVGCGGGSKKAATPATPATPGTPAATNVALSGTTWSGNAGAIGPFTVRFTSASTFTFVEEGISGTYTTSGNSVTATGVTGATKITLSGTVSGTALQGTVVGTGVDGNTGTLSIPVTLVKQ